MTMQSARLGAPRPAGAAATEEFARDLAASLRHPPRWIPSKYLYDDSLGTALSDAVTRLPWYTVSRAEEGLLRRHATDIFAGAGPLAELLEFGGGRGARLLTLVLAGRRGPGPLDVHLVDVSSSALAEATATLGRLEGVRLITHESTYEHALDRFCRSRAPGRRRLAVLLGSILGGVAPAAAPALLRRVRAALDPGEALLVGVDLPKSEGQMVLAYDDPLGVNAALTRNLIVRINRELGGALHVAAFTHRAVWSAAEQRVDRELVSAIEQRVQIPAAGLDVVLGAGEPICVSTSYKYDPGTLAAALMQSRFRRRAQWVDQEHGYALTLAEAS